MEFNKLKELKEICKKSNSLGKHFFGELTNDLEERINTSGNFVEKICRESENSYLSLLERDLQRLDSSSWDSFKKYVTPSLWTKNEKSGWQQLNCKFNEARTYAYLLKNERFNHIEFIRKNENHMYEIPSLIGNKKDKSSLLDVVTIQLSGFTEEYFSKTWIREGYEIKCVMISA